jgi:putative membrane protein insertion efficiency factor
MTVDHLPAATEATGAPKMTPAARLLRRAVLLYQGAFAGRPSPCRFVPSCSSYAVEALERHGAWRGTWLAVRRVGRCHPWGGHGLDPVPPARRERATHRV